MDRVEKIICILLVCIMIPVVGMLGLAFWYMGKILGVW